MAKRVGYKVVEECALLTSIDTAMKNVEEKIGQLPSLIRLCTVHLDELDQHAKEAWASKGSMLGTRLFHRQIVQEMFNKKERCILCEDSVASSRSSKVSSSNTLDIKKVK